MSDQHEVSGRPSLARITVEFLAATMLFLVMFGGAGVGLALFLDHLATQPYQPDRVIVVTR
jgi:hypothetical protein